MNLVSITCYLTIKAIGDYVFSFLSLIILSPLLILLSIFIFITGGSPVIFSQKRTGKDGRIFMIYKFRSLMHGKNEGIDLIADKYIGLYQRMLNRKS